MMAIIDPDGLFSGERLASCSDAAQLYWPRFFIASNGYARLELSYTSIISKIFGNFQNPPKAEDVWSIFEEYSKNCLVILYRFEGVWWAQFDTSEKYLPRFKKVRDEQSPAPTHEEMENHRKSYLKWKSSNSLQNETFRKTTEDFGIFPRERGGVGVGIGVGVGKAKHSSRAKKQREVQSKAPCKTDILKARHKEFKAAIGLYWQSKNPGVDMPWGAPEGKSLEMWLKESPNTTIDQFREYLRNRFRSEVNHTERPSIWLRRVTDYATEPQDRFGKPKSLNGLVTNGHAPKSPPSDAWMSQGDFEPEVAAQIRERLKEKGVRL